MANLNVIETGGFALGGEEIVARELISPVVGAETGGFIMGGTENVGFFTPAAPPVTASTDVGVLKLGGPELVAFFTPKAPPAIPPGGPTSPDWLQELLGVPNLVGGFIMGGDEPVTVGPPPVLEVVETGGFIMGAPYDSSLAPAPEVSIPSPISPEAIDAFLPPGGFIMGGDEPVTFSSKPPVYAEPVPGAGAKCGFRMGGEQPVAFIYPQIQEVIEEGGLALGGEPEVDYGIFETYVLNGARDEPSIYSGFNFNSYARYHGRYYGAGPAGISLLEGEDDAGAKIHAGLRLASFNVGTEREKRVRIVRCGGDTRGAQVKVSSNGDANYADVQGGVAEVDRSVQGRELVVEITDFKTLDHLEIVPIILAKR